MVTVPPINMTHVVNDRTKQQNRHTQKMNDMEEEIYRTEKINYRKDRISTNTIKSQIEKKVYTCIVCSTYFAIHMHLSAVGWACIRNTYYYVYPKQKMIFLN